MSRSSPSPELSQAGEFAPGQPSPGEELARLRARVLELETASSQDDQANAMLAMLSHELRSPLQSLLLNLDLCLQRARGPQSDPTTAWLADRLIRQRRTAARLRVLIDTFLDVGQIAAGALRLEPEDVDLGELVTDVVRRAADELTWARCPCQLEVQPGVSGRWDRLQTELVVANLLSNALKYGSGTPVEIAVRGSPEAASLQVRDHGPGIAPRDQRRIFEKFTRLDAPSKVGGFGLGLWIVEHVVIASGGSVAVDSAPGQGATFTVSLPRSR